MTGSTEILVTVEHSAWEDALPEVEALVLRAAEAALAGAVEDDLYDIPTGPSELSVVLADDAMVHELNRTYRGKDKPTNVLSFALFADAEQEETDEDDLPIPEGVDGKDGDEDAESLAPSAPPPVLLGDVILAYETVARESAEQGKALADHLTHLVVHGVLHLIGYDHIADDEADDMERLETGILDKLGIPDPYAGSDGYRPPDEPDDPDGRKRPGAAPTS